MHVSQPLKVMVYVPVIFIAPIRLGAIRVPIVLPPALTESASSALAAIIGTHHTRASAILLQTTAWTMKQEHSQQLCKEQRTQMVEHQRIVRGQLVPFIFLLKIIYCV
jgi:hypothetical protein